MAEWVAERLPEETVALVRQELGPLADGIITAVRAGSPAYAEVLGAPEGMALRIGIEQAIGAFLAAVQRGERPAGETDELWRRLGEAEFQSGRSLDDLRAAFRAGIRGAWRGAADIATRAGVSAPVVIALAEAIFVYGDELATDVVEGYLRIQTDEAGERERRRRRLAVTLTDPAGQDPDSVARAAELARWTVPRELAVIVPGSDDAAAIARRLDADVLVGSDAAGLWLVVPDPDGPGRRAAVDRALEGEVAAIGPTVRVADAYRSLRLGRLALSLAGQAALDGGTPVRVEDHLAAMVLHGDPELARALADARLAPLAGLAVGERDRLTETLSAWLAHQRRTPQIAAELHVHPQTVRYRLARLRELFGDALEDPQGRFELDLALRIAAAPSTA